MSKKTETEPQTVPAKPWTQKQKDLAERAIKLKYNGLINALADIQTEHEVANRPVNSLPAGPTTHVTAYYGGRQPEAYTAPSSCDNGWPEHIKKAALELYSFWQQWADEFRTAHEAYRAKKAALEAEWKELDTKLLEECLDKTQTVNDLIDAENEKRYEARELGRKARVSTVMKLREQRDQSILNVAFRGETGMDEFLSSLPSPETVTEMLTDCGCSLTKELPEVTGIGETNPTSLTDYGKDPS